MNSLNQKDLKNFYSVINKLAPAKGTELIKKYPYKPFAIMAILSINELETILDKNSQIIIDFNKYIPMSIADRICKKFYDLLVSDIYILDELKKIIRKDLIDSLEIGYNRVHYFKIRSLLFEMPFKKMKCSLFKINNKTITLIKPSYIKTNDFIEGLKKQCISTLVNICIPSYNLDNIDFNWFINYEEYQMNELQYYDMDESNEEIRIEKRRKFQNIYSKQVKDRDQKCLVCCENFPSLLEACHIKNYRDCTNNLERYDSNNGITLCSNHHKLFDKYYFTFNEKWDVLIDSSLSKEQKERLLIVHKNCFEQIKQNKGISFNPYSDYLKYRNNNIENKEVKWEKLF